MNECIFKLDRVFRVLTRYDKSEGVAVRLASCCVQLLSSCKCPHKVLMEQLLLPKAMLGAHMPQAVHCAAQHCADPAESQC